jgi:20S proteasome alpha/beta subunit
MRRLLLALVLVLVAVAPDKDRGRFGGTFIGAMIAEEGIVLASDSRSTFITQAGERMGYVDRVQKIFVDHGAAFAMSGLTSVEGELFSAFMRRNHVLLDRPANEILLAVALWLPFQNSNHVLLISAGYVDGAPMICALGPNEPQECRKSGIITNKPSPGILRWLDARNGRVPKASEAASALKMAIREAADLDSAVGGPTTILLLQKSGAPQWLENPPVDSGWTRVCDIVNDYRLGRTQIFFTNTKEELDRHLAGACPR